MTAITLDDQQLISLKDACDATSATIASILATVPPTPPAPPVIIAGTPVAMVYNGSGPLNVRNGPSTSGVIVGTLTTGAVLNVIDAKVTANGHPWAQIASDAYAGSYVALDLLSPKN